MYPSPLCAHLTPSAMLSGVGTSSGESHFALRCPALVLDCRLLTVDPSGVGMLWDVGFIYLCILATKLVEWPKVGTW